MATAITLYRLSSNEVIKISVMTSPQTFDSRDTDFFGTLVDPSYPDGTSVFDPDDEPPIKRKFGFAKFADVGGDEVRNATQVEIDTWAAAELDDDNQADANRAADLGDTHPQFRKIFKSLLKSVVRENNIMATQWNEFRVQVSLATDFNDLKTRVAADTSDVPIRTNQQAFDALRPDINKDD